MKNKIWQNDDLCKDFYKNVLESEILLEKQPSIKLLNELFLLYKKGVEYHSDKCKIKIELFVLKIQTLMSNKIINKLVSEEENNETFQTRESTLQVTSTNIVNIPQRKIFQCNSKFQEMDG
jgi:hypothetical protein